MVRKQCCTPRSPTTTGMPRRLAGTVLAASIGSSALVLVLAASALPASTTPSSAASIPGNGPTTVLRDIFSGAPAMNGSSSPLFFLEFNDRSYFQAFDADGGTELWSTDGTTEGTARFLDLCPGACSSSAVPLERVGETLFFMADDGVWGHELWKSDGTPEGTQRLTDISTLNAQHLVPLAEATFVYEDLLLFTPDTESAGIELWRTDGTAAGTYMVRDIYPGHGSSYPTGFIHRDDGRVYFTAADPEAGSELWRTDGTEEGTERVTDLWPGPGSGVRFSLYFETQRALTQAPDGRILFAGNDGISGEELWTTDGTPEGTVLVKDIRPGSASASPRAFQLFDGEVYFQADDGESGPELWASDGTSAGTHRIADIQPGPIGSEPWLLTATNGSLFFIADDGSTGVELWRLTDGHPEQVRDIAPGLESSAPYLHSMINNTVYFVAFQSETGAELWRSDGTENGTFIVRDIFTGPDFAFVGVPYYRPIGTLLDSLLLFGARDSLEIGIELWASDGSLEGTERLLDIRQSPGDSKATEFTALGERVVFFADNGLAGQELWGTDGTEVGTEFLADIRIGQSDSKGHGLTRRGEELLFSATDGFLGEELWKTDGTSAGTELVQDIQLGQPQSMPREFTALGEQIVFAADDGLTGRELWLGDGSEGGTQLVKDLWPDDARSSDPDGLTEFDGQIYLGAQPGPTGGRQLWKSDGTVSGTVIVRTPEDGGPRQPEWFEVAGSRLFFAADGGDLGRELWQSDGTSEGTVRVLDLHPTGDGIPTRSDAESAPIASLGSLILFAGDDGSSGNELWASDGTEAGTFQLADIEPGPGSSVPRFPTTAGNQTFFAARDLEHGEELWVTDGTASGTRRVTDLRPGPDSSTPRHLTPFEHLLYFTATDGLRGVELWRSDGTPSGTILLEDIFPGELSSNPTSLRVVDDRLYFSAVDPDLGGEPRFLELRPTVELSGSCDEGVTVKVSGLTPGGRAAIFWGEEESEAEVPRGRCAGSSLTLDSPTFLASPTADRAGRARWEFEDGGGCGTKLQVIDRRTCLVGEAVEVGAARTETHFEGSRDEF